MSVDCPKVGNQIKAWHKMERESLMWMMEIKVVVLGLNRQDLSPFTTP